MSFKGQIFQQIVLILLSFLSATNKQAVSISAQRESHACMHLHIMWQRETCTQWHSKQSLAQQPQDA